jgi:hypothetical protein
MGFALHGFSILLATMLSIVPLNGSQRDRLSRAVDGADHREDAFLALVENVRDWTQESSPQEAVSPVADIAQLIANLGDNRGRLFRIEGTLEQSTTLAPPYEDVQEWFVRNAAGTPMAVYVCNIDESLSSAGRPRVIITARLYKRMDFTARDGQKRSYAAFVGANPVVVPTSAQYGSTSNSFANVWFIAVPVAALLIVFIVLRSTVARRTSRYPGPMNRPRLSADIETSEEPPNLPDDPVDALAELKRRAHDCT